MKDKIKEGSHYKGGRQGTCFLHVSMQTTKTEFQYVRTKEDHPLTSFFPTISGHANIPSAITDNTIQ